MNGRSPSLIRSIRGPIMMITVGVLFALDHMTEFSITRTWPAILIVLGVLGLSERYAGPRIDESSSRPAPDFRGGQ